MWKNFFLIIRSCSSKENMGFLRLIWNAMLLVIKTSGQFDAVNVLPRLHHAKKKVCPVTSELKRNLRVAMTVHITAFQNLNIFINNKHKMDSNNFYTNKKECVKSKKKSVLTDKTLLKMIRATEKTLTSNAEITANILR